MSSEHNLVIECVSSPVRMCRRAQLHDHARDPARSRAAAHGGARCRSPAHPRPRGGRRAVDDGRLHALRVEAGAAGAALPARLPAASRIGSTASPRTADGKPGAAGVRHGLPRVRARNEALYGLMFERAAPDFIPSDASRMAGLTTFEMLAQPRRRVAARLHRPSSRRTPHLGDDARPASPSSSCTGAGAAPSSRHLQGDPEQNFATRHPLSPRSASRPLGRLQPQHRQETP